MIKIDDKLQRKVLSVYDFADQSMVQMEECSELSQAISKCYRNGGKENFEPCRMNLCEEIADVLICINQLLQTYWISDSEVQTWIDYKQKRMKERIGEK